MSPRERGRRQRHRRFMETYWSARHAWELAAEAATSAYHAEMAEFRAGWPPPTFKRYLIDTRGMPR